MKLKKIMSNLRTCYNKT